LVPPDPLFPLPPDEQLASAGEIIEENASNVINTTGDAKRFFCSISSEQRQALSCTATNKILFTFFYTLISD
jgi:hypothetical protein